MTDTPERIWLQWHGDADPDEAGVPDPSDVTWCEDKINDSDTEYVRADLAVSWRDVADELPQEAQEVLFVRGGKTLHGAWIGGIFWHSNQKMAAAKWMPLPMPPNA